MFRFFCREIHWYIFQFIPPIHCSGFPCSFWCMAVSWIGCLWPDHAIDIRGFVFRVRDACHALLQPPGPCFSKISCFWWGCASWGWVYDKTWLASGRRSNARTCHGAIHCVVHTVQMDRLLIATIEAPWANWTACVAQCVWRPCTTLDCVFVFMSCWMMVPACMYAKSQHGVYGQGRHVLTQLLLVTARLRTDYSHVWPRCPHDLWTPINLCDECNRNVGLMLPTHASILCFIYTLLCEYIVRVLGLCVFERLVYWVPDYIS